MGWSEQPSGQQNTRLCGCVGVVVVVAGVTHTHTHTQSIYLYLIALFPIYPLLSYPSILSSYLSIDVLLAGLMAEYTGIHYSCSMPAL